MADGFFLRVLFCSVGEDEFNRSWESGNLCVCVCAVLCSVFTVHIFSFLKLRAGILKSNIYWYNTSIRHAHMPAGWEPVQVRARDIFVSRVCPHTTGIASAHVYVHACVHVSRALVVGANLKSIRLKWSFVRAPQVYGPNTLSVRRIHPVPPHTHVEPAAMLERGTGWWGWPPCFIAVFTIVCDSVNQPMDRVWQCSNEWRIQSIFRYMMNVLEFTALLNLGHIKLTTCVRW